jgi:hypothetical protein
VTYPLSEVQLARGLAAFGVAVSLWVLWLVIRDYSAVYANIVYWSGGNKIGAIAFVTLVASTVVWVVLVSYSIFQLKRSWLQLLVCGQVVVFFGGLPSLALLVAVFIWWVWPRVFPVT